MKFNGPCKFCTGRSYPAATGEMPAVGWPHVASQFCQQFLPSISLTHSLKVAFCLRTQTWETMNTLFYRPRRGRDQKRDFSLVPQNVFSLPIACGLFISPLHCFSVYFWNRAVMGVVHYGRNETCACRNFRKNWKCFLFLSFRSLQTSNKKKLFYSKILSSVENIILLRLIKMLKSVFQ